MKKCPYCGAQMNDDSLFCTECGIQIPQGIVCPHCGASIGENDAFCQNCGKRVDDSPSTDISNITHNKCPYCGASVNEGDVFCENCGRNLIDGSYANNSIINEQIQEDEEEPRRNSIPYVLGAIAIIAICGGGWWYYNSSKAPQSNIEATVAEAVDADSVDADSVAAEAVEEDFAVDTLTSDFPPMEQALNAYEPILDKYIAKGESNNHYEEYYFLHDVTGDGIPEFQCRSCTSSQQAGKCKPMV